MALGTPVTAARDSISQLGSARTAAGTTPARSLNVAQTNGGSLWGKIGNIASQVGGALTNPGAIGGALVGMGTKVGQSVATGGSPTAPQDTHLIGTRPVGAPRSETSSGAWNPWAIATQIGKNVGQAGASGAIAKAGISPYQQQLDSQLQQIAAQIAAAGGDYETQKALLDNTRGLSAQEHQNAQTILQQQIDQQRALLGSEAYRNVDLQMEANTAQEAAATDLYRRQSELLQKDWGWNQQQQQLASQARQLAEGFYGKTKDLTMQGNELGYQQGTRKAQSDVTGRGSYMSAGYGHQLGDLASERDLSNSRAQSSFDYNMGQAGQQYEGTKGGLESSWNQRDYQHKNQYADYQENMQKSDRTKRFLTSLAGDYGVRQGGLDNALRTGMDKLGINFDQAMNALDQALASKNTEKMNTIQMLYQQALSAAGSAPAGTSVNPSFLAAIGGGSVGGNTTGWQANGQWNSGFAPATPTAGSGSAPRGGNFKVS